MSNLVARFNAELIRSREEWRTDAILRKTAYFVAVLWVATAALYLVA